jgi:hypothetical protein
MSMAGHVRVQVVVASCVLLVTAGVFVTDARAWATAHTMARCGRAAATPSAGPDQPPPAPARSGTAGQPGTARQPGTAGQPDDAVGRLPQRGTGHASGRSWRGHSLRAVGCSAWNEMHHRRARRA